MIAPRPLRGLRRVWQSLLNRIAGQTPRPRARRGVRLTLEVLEDRSLPSITCNPVTVNVLHDQTFASPSVVANVTDTGPGPVSIHLQSGPSVGSFVMNPAGSYQFTPPPGYTGQTQFTYLATDGPNSATGSVTLNVYDNALTAANLTRALSVNGTLSSVNVLASANDADGDSLRYAAA